MTVSSAQIFNSHTHELGAAYPVLLPAFEGPLDLLLQLIERQEMDISRISLVAVTDQYLQTLEHLEEIQPGAIADFLVVASRLQLIKSRRLLPRPQTNDDDDEEDEGDALIRQLLEYRRFKEIAESLKEREEKGLRSYLRLAPGPTFEKRLDMSNVDMDRLHRALRRALARIPSDPPMPAVHTYPITISEQIENVRSHIRAIQHKTSAHNGSAPAPVAFTDLLSQSFTRMEVVVTFLAILELIKQHELVAIQDDVFGEIMLMPLDGFAQAEDLPETA